MLIYIYKYTEYICIYIYSIYAYKYIYIYECMMYGKDTNIYIQVHLHILGMLIQ